MRTERELRELLRDGDGHDRVDAAFALALRLGRQALVDIEPSLERDPGVRAHWLTILASFGEVAAVRTIAEHGETEPERAHAVALAAQLGVNDSTWFAAVLHRVGERTQAMLLEFHRASVAWHAAVAVLLALLESDVLTFRNLAATELLALHPDVDLERMRAAAVARPDERSDVLLAWAAGRHHLGLVRAAAANCKKYALTAALTAAGRRYTLDELEVQAVGCPALLVLLDLQPGDPAFRLQYLKFFGTLIGADRPVPPVAYSILAKSVPPPLAEAELQVLAAWQERAAGEKPVAWAPEAWAPGWYAHDIAVWGLVTLGLLAPPPAEDYEQW